MTGLPVIVPHDTAARIIELRDQGYSYSRISVVTGISRATCYRVFEGKHNQYSDELTARERMRLLVGWPVVGGADEPQTISKG